MCLACEVASESYVKKENKKYDYETNQEYNQKVY